VAQVIYLAALLEVVEENPAVEALHLPRFLLPQENMLESAGAKDPAPAAVQGEPQLPQLGTELRRGAGEQALGSKEPGQGRGTTYLRVSAITGDLRTSARNASSSLVSAPVTLSFTATSSS